MNKSELIDAVSSDTGLTKSDAGKALDSVVKNIQRQLKKGDEVRLVGFGTFKVSKRAARTGRNPRTGEPLKIAASSAPVFRAGKELKESINSK